MEKTLGGKTPGSQDLVPTSITDSVPVTRVHVPSPQDDGRQPVSSEPDQQLMTQYRRRPFSDVKNGRLRGRSRKELSMV